MKNRLQFNRHYAIYPSREDALTAFSAKTTEPGFIALIGEPIALRYRDSGGNVQLMLAIGKRTGTSVTDREYQIIDTAFIDERIVEEISARTATDEEIFGILSGLTATSENLIEIVGSGWTDEPDKVTITDRLKRDEELAGIKWGHDEGEPFDGKLDPVAQEIPGDSIMKKLVAVRDASAFMDGATNARIDTLSQHVDTEINNEHGYRKAIEIKEIDQRYYQRLGLGDDIRNAYFLTTHRPGEGNFDQYTYPENGETIIKVYKDPVYSLNLDSENAVISLDWTDDEGQPRSSSINVSDFTKDSFLENVQVVTRDGVQYIEFRFKTYDGEPVPIYVPLTDLATIYKAGEGIDRDELENNQIVTVKIDPMHEGEESYLTKSPNGLRVTGITEYVDDAIATALSGLDMSDYVRKDEVEDHLDDQSTLPVQNKVITEALSDLEGQISGISFDEIYEYVDDAVGELSGIVIDNEEVTAAALNDLNDRLGIVETHMTGEYIPLTGYKVSTASTPEDLLIEEDDTVNEAFGKVQKQVLDNDDAIGGLDERLTVLEGAVADNSGVTALSAAVITLSSATLNKFNEINTDITNMSGSVVNNHDDIVILSGMLGSVSAKTSGVLTINLNGVEQGKYCPSASTTVNLEAIQEVTGADVLLTGYKISSGTTEEELIVVAADTVNDAFGKIQKQIYDNEAVVAGALNDLNDRTVDLEDTVVKAISVNGGTPISANSENVVNIQLDVPAVNNFFDGAEYVSSAKTIIFTHNGEVKSTIDATDFIKDGMVDNVEVVNNNLVITFNTDAGKQPISIPISRIFDSSLYYTKTEVNTISGDIVTYINQLSAGTIQLSADTKATFDELSASVVYNKTNIQTVSGDVIALSAACVTMSGDIATNRTDINDLSATMIDNELVIAAAFNDLNGRVIELSGKSVDLSNYYTKNEVYNKEEIMQLFSASGGNPDAAISALTESLAELSAATVSLSSATHNKFTSLSAATTAISQNVTNLSAATTAISQNVTNLSAATTAISQNLSNLSGAVQNNYYTKSEVNGLVKRQFSTAASVTNLTFEKFLTVVTLGSNTNLTITNSPSWDMENGEVVEAHVIIQNTGSTGITVTLPTGDSRVKVTGDTELLVDPDGFGEVNAMITKTGANAYVIYLITSF